MVVDPVSGRPCAACRCGAQQKIAEFAAPPPGENPFPYDPYWRRLWQCQNCGHVTNEHHLDLQHLYEGTYREAAYGDSAGLRRTFERIMGLPPERSDNRQRVSRIDRYFSESRLGPKELLDVGSGLGVFPVAMAELGWACTALDPDPLAVKFVEERGVQGVLGGFLEAQLDTAFSLITFNKVLEHVEDMSPFLEKATELLHEDGLIYVEVPDADGALNDPDGPQREEFFLEHYCAPTPASVTLLMRRAQFRIESLETLREPSGKYTIRVFARPLAA